MIEKILYRIKYFLPKKLLNKIRPFYHRAFAFFAALLYGFPSRKINVVAISGTKGKSTTVEILNAILEEAGLKTAVAGTIRFKIGEKSTRNMKKMTVPGRLFVQKFLRQAVKQNCDWVLLELTSEGAKQFRHKHIALNGFIFTNLSPEHIESHGSYENYREAKLSIARLLEKSPKRETILVSNKDDKESAEFEKIKSKKTLTYSLKDAEPYELLESSSKFTFDKEKISLPLPGLFNIYNALAASTFAKAIGIEKEYIKTALENFKQVRGRVEYIKKGQPFDVVVDYAHTIDSLEKFYGIFKTSKNICILGNTGGGRDKWKRGKMAKVAEENCAEVILTNEDPYDEDPKAIVSEMYEAIEDKLKAEIIMDRREAIHEALRKAKLLSGNKKGDRIAVLITGKGTDPYIMAARGKKIPWDDATVVREELQKLGY